MSEWQFPSIQELDEYQRQREERIDASISEFLAQLHIIVQLPLADLSASPGAGGGADPTSVMVALPNVD
ncbi:MAG: hypothetical protein CMB11_09460 [Euryarchaeota archaeon]|nr:hypothetical protein [Euryarchaeota archaeon]MBD40569.1 hypothetical protein [Euryarchaeota archaeon]|tara:strand:- start:907 stop:1113 length:207 start_codon:yes stop_codon:yes gene_type:complete